MSSMREPTLGSNDAHAEAPGLARLHALLRAQPDHLTSLLHLVGEEAGERALRHLAIDFTERYVPLYTMRFGEALRQCVWRARRYTDGELDFIRAFDGWPPMPQVAGQLAQGTHFLRYGLVLRPAARGASYVASWACYVAWEDAGTEAAARHERLWQTEHTRRALLEVRARHAHGEQST